MKTPIRPRAYIECIMYWLKPSTIQWFPYLITISIIFSRLSPFLRAPLVFDNQLAPSIIHIGSESCRCGRKKSVDSLSYRQRHDENVCLVRSKRIRGFSIHFFRLFALLFCFGCLYFGHGIMLLLCNILNHERRHQKQQQHYHTIYILHSKTFSVQ